MGVLFPFGLSHPGMPLQGKGDIIFDRHRVVQRRFLKKKTHLFSDFVQLAARQSANFFSLDMDRAGVGRLQADDQLQDHTFSAAAFSKHGDGFAFCDLEIDPSEHSLAAEALVQVFHDHRRVAIHAGLSLWKKDQNQTDQHNIRENDEQRGKYYRAGSGPAYAFGAALDVHPLEAADDADNSAVDRGLQSGGNEIVKGHIFESALEKELGRNGLCERGGAPPITTPQKSAARVRSGSIRMQAATRVAARYLKGSTAEASIASICSVTFIDPSSAPMPAPTRPLTTRPVMTGPVSLTMEKTTTAGRNDRAPNLTRLACICSAMTTPVAAPAIATRGRDRDPAESHCRINSRNSQGGDNAARVTRLQKTATSPNHSKNWTKRCQISSNVLLCFSLVA